MRIRPAVPWAWLSALAELLGGLGFAVGLLTPLPGLAIAASMLVAIALVHWPKGFFATKGGYEFNLAILAAVAAIALSGAGAYSLDAALRLHLPEPVTLIIGTVLVLLGVGLALGTRTPAPLTDNQAAGHLSESRTALSGGGGCGARALTGPRLWSSAAAACGHAPGRP